SLLLPARSRLGAAGDHGRVPGGHAGEPGRVLAGRDARPDHRVHRGDEPAVGFPHPDPVVPGLAARDRSLWFPDWLLAIARATPFPSMIQTPIDTLSGRLSPAEALPLVGVQIGWV